MRRYRPDSYSKQARKFCDKLLKQIQDGDATIEWALLTIHNSYRCKLIRRRALSRFFRKIRNGNYKENPIAIQEWNDYKSEYGIFRYSIEEELYDNK